MRFCTGLTLDVKDTIVEAGENRNDDCDKKEIHKEIQSCCLLGCNVTVPNMLQLHRDLFEGYDGDRPTEEKQSKLWGKFGKDIISVNKSKSLLCVSAIQGT